MTTRTGTLAEFLLARIAEDEADARFGLGHPYDARYDPGSHDPTRVLAECESMRLILALHEPLPRDPRYPECQSCGAVDGDCPTLRALASQFADHAEFRSEWA